ncbi:MAG: SPOR domain-containing protein [Gammaproteobacteria bacterium]|nr:SPOR domain-containing protein [Gammaproteobacteria bacterium]
MMEQQLKERLVGATVLVVLAIIIIPVILDGPGSDKPSQQRLDLPAAQSNGERRTVRIPLDEPSKPAVEKRSAGQETPETEPPVSEPAETRPVAEAGSTSPETEAATSGTQPRIVEREPEETTAREPESQPATSKPAPASSQPWTVQVGSFSSEENAEGLVKRLKSLGYSDAFVSRYNDGSMIHYRVRVGGYADRDAAAARAEEIRSRSGEPARPAKN